MKAIPKARNELEVHAEKFIRELAERNEAGSYIDVPQLDYEWQPFQAAVNLWCGRLIRKPCGNRNGTYKMSQIANPGYYRITLVNKIPAEE